jgi:hypothetical protein
MALDEELFNERTSQRINKHFTGFSKTGILQLVSFL